MKKTIKTLIMSAAAMSVAVSCLSLDTAPYDRETDLTYWDEDPNAAYNAVNSCYNTIISMQELLFADCMADNGYMHDTETNTNGIANGSYSTSESYVEAIWDSRYSGIKYCNELLDNIDRVPGLDPALKNRYIGEAKVIRAFHYYELYTKFGDVPYFEHVIGLKESQTISRTPRAEVIGNILRDLSEVIDGEYLPASYQGIDKGRITKWAAMAIKAKVHLFEGQWTEVKKLTSEIMTKGGFDLFGSYEGLFEIANEGNCEVILDAQYTPVSREDRTQYYFLPPSMGGYAKFAPLQELVDSYIMLDGKTVEEAKTAGEYDEKKPYEGRDPRLAVTIAYPGSSYTVLKDGKDAVHPVKYGTDEAPGQDAMDNGSGTTMTGYYLKKWWDKTYRAEFYSALNPIVIRYADILLMNAEALAELGELDAAAWNATVKKIRTRAGFTEASALDFPAGKNLVEIVRNERRSELAFEGLRHKDIIRWKIAEDVMNGNVHGIYTGETIGTDNGYKIVENRVFQAEKHYLWPVPQADRDLNGNLTQNPNW